MVSNHLLADYESATLTCWVTSPKDKEYLRKKSCFSKCLKYEVSFLSLYLNADRLGFEPRPYKLTVYCTTIMLSVQIKEGITKISVYI